jgi:hypothetical protein
MNLACPGPRHDAIEGGRHKGDDRVLDPGLHRRDGPPGVALIPNTVEVLGRQAELDDQVAGEVLRPDLAPLFLPEADQGFFVLAHDDPGIGAADEVAAGRFVLKGLCHPNAP